MVEALKGQVRLADAAAPCHRLLRPEEYLLFSAFTDAGKSLDQETCEKLFNCTATVERMDGSPADAKHRLIVESEHRTPRRPSPFAGR